MLRRRVISITGYFFVFLSIKVVMGGKQLQTKLFASTSMHFLQTNSIKSIVNISAMKCAQICSTNETYASFNFNKENRTCDILQITKEDATDSLVPHAQWTYYEKITSIPVPLLELTVMQSENPCEPNPCLNNSSCTVVTSLNSSDYTCNCIYPMEGKNCSNNIATSTTTPTTSSISTMTTTVTEKNGDPCNPNPCLNNGNCSTAVGSNPVTAQCICQFPTTGNFCGEIDCGSVKCYHQSDGWAVFIYNKNSMNWSAAYSNCLSKGMKLAMPKTNDTYTLIRQTLLKYNPSTGNNLNEYWMGLSRNKSGSLLTWIDGTTLGDFHPWYSNNNNYSPTENCVKFNYEQDKRFYWIDEACNYNNLVFPVCEQNYTLS